MSYTEKIKMPPGKYFLGDISYAFEKGWYDCFMDSCRKDDYQYKNKTVIIFGTAYGDGEYEDNFGNKFPVDAGIIGMLPVSLIEVKGKTKNEWLNKAGIFIDVGENFYAQNEGGIMDFGPHHIDTLNQDDDEDEEYCSHCGRGH